MPTENLTKLTKAQLIKRLVAAEEIARAHRKPKPGEIWRCPDGSFVVFIREHRGGGLVNILFYGGEVSSGIYENDWDDQAPDTFIREVDVKNFMGLNLVELVQVP